MSTQVGTRIHQNGVTVPVEKATRTEATSPATPMTEPATTDTRRQRRCAATLRPTTRACAVATSDIRRMRTSGVSTSAPVTL